MDRITIVKSRQVRKIRFIFSRKAHENDSELHLYTAGSLTTASLFRDKRLTAANGGLDPANSKAADRGS